MSELKTWIREPDYAEAFSIAETIDWINRRPIAEVVAIPEWQPIESAPKDGTPMLLTRWSTATQDTLPITSGFWSRVSNRFFSEISGRDTRPTHWMPLPAPPACG